MIWRDLAGGDLPGDVMPGLDSYRVILGGAVLLVTAFLTIGAVYFGGGMLAVRRQMPLIATLLAALALVFFVVEPILTDRFGPTLAALALGLSALVWIASRRSRRTTYPIRTPTGRTMARGTFVALWLGIAAFFIVLSTVLAIAMRPAP